jgi:Fe2+ or Zn2+ uptake regulation protein
MQEIYDILGRIKTQNRRVTRARLGILKAVFEAKKPVQNKDIQKWLRKNRIRVDRSTVYRQLRYLTAKKFLNKFQIASGKIYFEPAKGHCHHLVCIRCKSITDIAFADCSKTQEEKILSEHGFKVLGHTLEFYGVCKTCQHS